MRNAVTGIMMPLVSMKPVASHCTVLLGTLNSRIRVGGAYNIIREWSFVIRSCDRGRATLWQVDYSAIAVRHRGAVAQSVRACDS